MRRRARPARVGALAVRPGRGAATAVTTWTEGAAPGRRLVVEWVFANAFPRGDPRAKIDGYYAWRAMARGRLTVGKLFGWITGRELPPPPLRDEPFDVDPGRSRAPVTPR